MMFAWMAQQTGHDVTAAVQKALAEARVTSPVYDGQALMDAVMKWLVEHGPKFLADLLVALLLLLVGSYLIRLATFSTRKALIKSRKINPLLENFICSVLHKTGWVILLMIVLPRLGINIAPLIAGVGVTGFIVGFAFQESLSNLAAGMMIAINQPFKVNDYVSVGGVEGSVTELNMMAATLTTGDFKKVVVPNKLIWGSSIINHTAMDRRRVDICAGIAYGADIGKARAVALEALRSIPGVLAEPAPIVEVMSMGDSAVQLAIRPWCKPADHSAVFFAGNQAVKEAFDKHEIEIPFPQVVVHQIRP